VRAEVAVSFAALALFAVAVHAPGARSDFSYDDLNFVLTNTAIRNPASALASFAQPFPPHLPNRGIYRPVTNLSYALDYQIGELEPRGYHWTNVALYVLVVWLVFALARFHDPDRRFAFAVAAVFAVHPVHCEAVDSVTGRSELLAAVFAIASILAFAGAARRQSAAGSTGRSGILVLVSAAAYAASAFSKEVGVFVPAVLAVYFLCHGRRPGESFASWGRRGGWLLAPFAGVALGYVAARWNALGWLSPEHSMLEARSAAFRLHTIGMSWLQYMRQLVAPATLHVDYYWDQFFLSPRDTLSWAIAGLSLLGATLAVFAAAVVRELRTARASGRTSILLCGLSFVLVFLFPVMHVLPTLGWMAERYLFLPSIGLCLLVGLVLREALRAISSPRTRRIAWGVLLAMAVAAGGVRSRQRALEWRDEVRLWQVEDAARPNDARILTNLSLAHAKREQIPEAWDALRRARGAEPRMAVVDDTLDSIEFRLRLLERARRSAD